MTFRDDPAPRRVRVGRRRAKLALIACAALTVTVPATAEAGWQTGNQHPPVFRIDDLTPTTLKICRDGFVWQVADNARRLNKVFVVRDNGNGVPDANARLTSPDNLKLERNSITLTKLQLGGLLDDYYEGPAGAEVFKAKYSLFHTFKFKHRQPQPGDVVWLLFLRDKDDPANALVPRGQLQDAVAFNVQNCTLSSDT
jgi:hypothetical protein